MFYMSSNAQKAVHIIYSILVPSTKKPFNRMVLNV